MTRAMRICSKRQIVSRIGRASSSARGEVGVGWTWLRLETLRERFGGAMWVVRRAAGVRVGQAGDAKHTKRRHCIVVFAMCDQSFDIGYQ